MKQKIWVKTVLFYLIGVFIFLNVQSILTPNWMYGDHLETTIKGFDKLEESLDVVFLGTSHVSYGISPMELYANCGICSYSLATAVQPPVTSYFLLKKAYETHDIKTVVLDVSTMFIDESEAGIQYVLDTLNYSLLKYEWAMDCGNSGLNDKMLSALFPIIQFHSNWSNLTETNFSQASSNYPYTMGQKLTASSSPVTMTFDEVNHTARRLSQYHGRKTEMIGDTIHTEEISSPLYTPGIQEEAIKYFLKLRDLCAKHGSNLLLIKIPSIGLPQTYHSTWTQIKSSIMKQFAEEQNVDFLDLVYDMDTLLLPDSDSFDGGPHLNTIGAKKISAILGDYLLTHHLAESRTSQAYDECLEKYQRMFAVAELLLTTDFYDYIRQIKEMRQDKTIVIAAAYDYASGLTPEDFIVLEELGLRCIQKGKPENSYICVIENGSVLYEAVSDYEIEYSTQAANASIEVISRNNNLDSPTASVQVNEMEYSQPCRGLSIIIYDHETGCVIDNVVFDTADVSKNAIRNKGWTDSLFWKYESALCYGGRWMQCG